MLKYGGKYTEINLRPEVEDGEIARSKAGEQGKLG